MNKYFFRDFSLMGRTKRKRNRKRKKENFLDEWSKIIVLLKSLKLKCKHFKICYFTETGRGMKCRKNFNVGDTLITLPLDILITPLSLNDLLFSLKTWNNMPQLDLTALLMYEKHLKYESKYFNYLTTLPDSYSNLYFCTVDEIKLLPDFIQKLAASQKKTIKINFQMVINSFQNAHCPHCNVPFIHIFTSKNFEWAWFTINTRSVYYQKEQDQKPSLALAPYLDLLNHSSMANTEMIIDHKEKVYILKTKVKLKKNKEAFIKYGCHSNLTLFLEYGFVTPNNPYDFIEFSFDEVVNSAKELNSNYGNISKVKHNFIINNNLNENLLINFDGFNWNLNMLIYGLIAQDENESNFLKKAYSGAMTSYESDAAKNIKKIILGKKLKEFLQISSKMKEIKEFTKSFGVAKDLVNIYIDLLKLEIQEQVQFAKN